MNELMKANKHKKLCFSVTPDIKRIIKQALVEDVGTGDVTTIALIDKKERAKAVILAKEECIVSGTIIAELVFKTLDKNLQVTIKINDGNKAKRNTIVMEIAGNARAILTAERTVLNFLQRMSGIATLTHRFVTKCANSRVRILDTRKTTPGMRILEKYAVVCGGGVNHRMGLFDAILIKDNHKVLWKKKGLSLAEMVITARKKFPRTMIEIEVENIEELKSVLPARPDWILLDNMSPSQLKRCVELCNHECKLEASGGVTLKNIEEIARTGVDAISIGGLTHSAPSIDFSLEIVS
jgi:nicotinate-nucleotide pyrophosphorylase (carboxylating)